MYVSRTAGFAAAARGASLLLLLWSVACRREVTTGTRSATPGPSTATTPVAPATTAPLAGSLPAQAPAQGILSLTTDLPCIVTVDGVEIGRLRRNSSDTFLVVPGRHLLAAVETDSQRSWAKVIEVPERQRVDVPIQFVTGMEDEATGFQPAMPGIEFVPIAAGEFWMGSDLPIEGKRHRVRITRAFEIARFLVTQEQWRRVIRRNPTPWDLENNDQPVVNVSWEETQHFMERLNKLDPPHLHRLPTEAEWEYVCRAGGDRDAEPRDPAARLGLGVDRAAVGLKTANAWGVFDMRGVVSEWCQDWYDQGYYERSPEADPQGPATGSARAFRGGAMAANSEGLRPAARASFPPTTHTTYIGFRVVRARSGP